MNKSVDVTKHEARELLRRQSLELPADRLGRLCRRFRIERLYMFGSFARGEGGPDSDLDLFVEYRPGAGEKGTHLYNMKPAFRSFVGRPVDMLTRFAFLNPVLEQHIKPDLVLLYDAKAYFGARLWQREPIHPLQHRARSGATAGQADTPHPESKRHRCSGAAALQLLQGIEKQEHQQGAAIGERHRARIGIEKLNPSFI